MLWKSENKSSPKVKMLKMKYGSQQKVKLEENFSEKKDESQG